jgi:hypothetical protein
MKTIALAFSLLATVGCSTLPHGTISRVDRDTSERHGTAGKRMCATTEDPTMRVAWHARTGDAPVRSIDVALLSR